MINGADPSAPAPQRQLVTFESVKLFPPGEPPVTYPQKQILAAGLQGMTPVVAVQDLEGRTIKYIGIPFISVERPTGLVAA